MRFFTSYSAYILCIAVAATGYHQLLFVSFSHYLWVIYIIVPLRTLQLAMTPSPWVSCAQISIRWALFLYICTPEWKWRWIWSRKNSAFAWFLWFHSITRVSVYSILLVNGFLIAGQWSNLGDLPGRFFQSQNFANCLWIWVIIRFFWFGMIHILWLGYDFFRFLVFFVSLLICMYVFDFHSISETFSRFCDSPLRTLPLW